MGWPRHFAISNHCLDCKLRQSSDFCNLPQPLMDEFNSIGHLSLKSQQFHFAAGRSAPAGRIHELLLARSSTEKLARLLLSGASDEPRNPDLRVPTEFTHHEIGLDRAHLDGSY
jgi:hypothetical protein